MKTNQFFKHLLLLLLFILTTSMTASAYDFSETIDGKVFYFSITSSESVRLTYALAHDYGDCYDNYGDVVIPSTIEHDGKTYTITEIGDHCFYGADITSISLPNTIQTIGAMAFVSCRNLTSLILPKSLTTIGDFAFSSCVGLTSLTIPENVITIGKAIYDNAAYLKTLYYNAINADGTEDPYNSEGAFVVSGNCEVIIGENVEHIPNYFICNSQIKSINIPSNVTSIGEYAFYNCSQLTNITISANVTTIEKNAFSGCSKILTVISQMVVPADIGSSDFPSRSNATLYVPAGCIPNYVTANYWKEFKEIKEPSRIYFEDSNVEAICVQNWDADGNGYLDQMEAVVVSDLGTAFQGNSQITTFNELSYFTGLTNISDNAFADCSNLTTITLPEYIKTIGSNAFTHCI